MSTAGKAGVTVAILLSAVGYMIFTTVSSGDALEYYKNVHEVMADPGAWKQRRLQLHGNVVKGTIVKRKGKLDFRFGLHRGGRWVDVTYSGLVPDAFKDCAEVIVKGNMTDDATFVATAISAKCPSKYDGKRRRGVCGSEHTEAVLRRRSGREL